MISIIIPVYNREHLILETLESIKVQCFKNWECIIVDDASTDNTFKIVENFIESDIRFKLTKRPEDLLKGPSSCRNYGFKISSGDFVQFFDSDDIMHPDHLQIKMDNIISNDFIVCKLKEFKGKFDFAEFDLETEVSLNFSSNIFEDFVTGEFPMMMVAPMWKKEKLNIFMPMREDMHILEDHEIYARALNTNPSYTVVNRSLIYYRAGEQSSSNSFFNNVDDGLDSFLIAKKTVLSISNSKVIKIAILKMVLGIFRLAIAQKNFKATETILKFIKDERLCFSTWLQMKLFRIKIVYLVVKKIGRGDTKLKPLLKI